MQRKAGQGGLPNRQQGSHSPNRNEDALKKKNNKASNLSHQYLERAHQVDMEAKNKEKQVRKPIFLKHY